MLDNVASGTLQPVAEVAKARTVPGYLSGMRQQALLVELVLDRARVTRQGMVALDSLFSRTLPAYVLTGTVEHPLVTLILRATEAVLRGAGIPTFDDGFVIGNFRQPGSVWLAVPALELEYAASSVALGWVIGAVNQVLSDQSTDDLEAGLPALTARLRRRAPAGMNSLRFLQAAHDSGIPWRRIANNVFQFGWGARARWMDSSLTDVTPSISAGLARDKRATAQVLRQAGIPVPAHAPVADAEGAVKVAEQLGFPVVVKPADQDGGLGVAAGLTTAEAVTKAFAAARALSNTILVEKHFEGNDYRLQVFQGEVFWVVHRVPGGVTGDGSSTVAELLAITNADPRRGEPGGNTLLKRIDIDEEARELLQEQGLTLEAVPLECQFVRLRRAANVATGGVPVPVLDVVHPDNLALAVRAARVLRLDLAGVDLLIQDIRKSWLETGAAICEVNAQPQLWPTLPAYLLKRLVKGQGRIPVLMVLGDVSDEAWFAQLLASLPVNRPGLGVATPEGVSIGTQTVRKGPCTAFQGGVALISDPQVEMAVICVGDERVFETRLPVDRFDVLVLAGSPVPSDNVEGWKRWQSFAQSIAPMCSGPIIVNQDCSQWLSFTTQLKGRKVTPVSPAGIVELVLQEFSEIAQ